MITKFSSIAGLLSAGLVLAETPPASATERRFTYTYGSGTLGAGEREIEPWTTFRVGRNGFYNAVDNRIEVEVGLTDRLQTSWYLNLSAENAEVPNTPPASGTHREMHFQHGGVSSEWKYKLMDPVADAVGLALYLELTGAPTEAEVETKIILDKRMGNFLWALNVVGEYDWDFSETPTTEEKYLELDGGLAYFLSPLVTVGLEARSDNEVGDQWEWSPLFAGPAVSYSAETWWAALTVLPQIANLKKTGDTGSLELTDHERVNARLIFGAHF